MKPIAFCILSASTIFAASAVAQNARTPQRPNRGRLEQPTNTTPMPMELAEPYRQLLEISIFARDRGPKPPPDDQIVSRVQRPNPENYLTFRGVADDGERIIAFIEDTRDGSAIRVRIDDPLANGKVVDIASGGLVYQRRARSEKFTIPLGSNLAGTEKTPTDASNRGFSTGDFPSTRTQRSLDRAVNDSIVGGTSMPLRSTTRGPGRTGRNSGGPSGRRRGGANGTGSAG